MISLRNLLALLAASAVLVGVGLSYGPEAYTLVVAKTDATFADARAEGLARRIGPAVDRQTLANGFARPTTLTCADAECSRIVELPDLRRTAGVASVRLVNVSTDAYQVVVVSESGRVTATYDSATQNVTSVHLTDGAVR